MKISRKEYYVDLLNVVRKRSECPRLSVGALLIDNGRICMTGYNGTPSGYAGNCCSVEDDECKLTIHAEMNVVAMCAKKGIAMEGLTLWVTNSPCANCAKVLANSGVKTVVYLEEYRDMTGANFLKGCGVNCIPVDEVDTPMWWCVVD